MKHILFIILSSGLFMSCKEWVEPQYLFLNIRNDPSLGDDITGIYIGHGETPNGVMPNNNLIINSNSTYEVGAFVPHPNTYVLAFVGNKGFIRREITDLNGNFWEDYNPNEPSKKIRNSISDKEVTVTFCGCK